jgi:hypothetical protein
VISTNSACACNSEILAVGAYSGAGRFSDAAQTIRQALAIAERQNDSQLVETLKTRLAYYESRR